MYGDEEDPGSDVGSGRPLSFVDGSSYHEQLQKPVLDERQHASASRPRPKKMSDFDSGRHLTRSLSDEPYGSHDFQDEQGASLRKAQTLHGSPSTHRHSKHFDGNSRSPASSTLSLRDVQADSSGSQFTLTNIDNPNDIAQELSNLQALRRMSMDVGNSINPDIPPMGLSAMPVIAPTGDDDENDPSRLLWVPARVHPELAPSEFKSFLENRVHSIRRRSGESFVIGNSDTLNGDSHSLSRRKSMLSRQIDTNGGQGPVGYVDGAERLERKRPSGGSLGHELRLDELVKDPTRAVQKLAQEAHGGTVADDGSTDDMPILPMAPGMGLRRSTRTTYRKGGSIRYGERAPFSKRGAQRFQDDDLRAATAAIDGGDVPKSLGLTRAQSEPTAENYSRPTRSLRRQHNIVHESDRQVAETDDTTVGDAELQVSSLPEQLSVRTQPSNVTSASVEAKPLPEGQELQPQHNVRKFPQRSSSQNSGSSQSKTVSKGSETTLDETSNAQASRHSVPATNSLSVYRQPSQTQYSSRSHSASFQSQNDNSGTSSALLSGDSSRTDNLTVIPTFSQVDKKPEKKSRRDRDDDAASTSSKSGGAWKWLKGVTDDKDKKKEETRRAKAKITTEKPSDNVRLDVIQNSIDRTSSKGRESLVLDRDSMDNKLLEERKKDSHRKGDSKKDKDGSIFSSIFGGSKRKEEKEKANKKSQHLQVPEEPISKTLLPDIDYHWTRFPLLEERAIYRMAHIKLANPRRPLLSQVLLSNFMYSYLAIVQAMHPQMNVPTSPQQKRLEEEARRKRQEQEYNAQRQTNDEDGDNSLKQYNFDYHRVSFVSVLLDVIAPESKRLRFDKGCRSICRVWFRKSRRLR